MGLLAFVLALAAGLAAGVSLLVDSATGISGFYVDAWVIAFFACAAAMITLFAISTGLGVAALAQRGPVPRWNSSHFLAAVAELIAIAGLVTIVGLGVVGGGAALLADLLILVFLGGLVRWNVAIWRELQVVPAFEQRVQRSLQRLADRIEDGDSV